MLQRTVEAPPSADAPTASGSPEGWGFLFSGGAMLPFAQIPSSILLNPDLTPRAIQVLGILALHGNNERRSWPKQGTIAANLRLTKQAVQLVIRELVQAKLVRVDHDYLLPSGLAVTSYVMIYPETRQLQVVTRQAPLVARQVNSPKADKPHLSMEGYTSKVPETTALLGVSASPEDEHRIAMARMDEQDKRIAARSIRG